MRGYFVYKQVMRFSESGPWHCVFLSSALTTLAVIRAGGGRSESYRLARRSVRWLAFVFVVGLALGCRAGGGKTCVDGARASAACEGEADASTDALALRTAGGAGAESKLSGGVPGDTTARAHRLATSFEHRCEQDIDRTLGPEQQLKQLEEQCVPEFRRVALEGSVVRLQKNQCVRVGVVASGSAEVRVRIADAVSRDVLDRSGVLPLLAPSSGPVCVGAAGEYRVIVEPVHASQQKPSEGASNWHVALWVSEGG